MRLTEAKMASLLFTLDILVYLEKRQVGILMFAKPTKGSGIVFLVLFPYNYFSGINQKTKLLGMLLNIPETILLSKQACS